MSKSLFKREAFNNCTPVLIAALSATATGLGWEGNRFAVKIYHNPEGTWQGIAQALTSAKATMLGMPKAEHTFVVANAHAIADLGQCRDISGLDLVRTADQKLVNQMPEGTMVNFRGKTGRTIRRTDTTQNEAKIPATRMPAAASPASPAA